MTSESEAETIEGLREQAMYLRNRVQWLDSSRPDYCFPEFFAVIATYAAAMSVISGPQVSPSPKDAG